MDIKQEIKDLENKLAEQGVKFEVSDESYWPSQEEMQEVEILQTVNKFSVPLTKTKLMELAVNAIDNMLINGHILQDAEAIKAMEEFLDLIRKNSRFISYVREEALKYKEGFKSPSGASIEAIEAGTKYDYSKCGDPVYNDLIAQKKELDEKIKDRELFLKNLKASFKLVDDEGEVHFIIPPVKTSTSSYKITLAK